MSTKFKVIFGVILVTGVIGLWATHVGYKKVDNYMSLEKYSKFLKKEFDEVEHISTSSLETLIRSHEAGIETLHLIDCRQPDEFAVSHIKGAANLQTAEDAAEYIKALSGSQEANIAIYCSVGYRSSQLAEELMEEGFSNTKNVLGSIFEWANEDRPLVNSEGQETTLVHPYNKFWKRHLSEGKAADVPDLE